MIMVTLKCCGYEYCLIMALNLNKTPTNMIITIIVILLPAGIGAVTTFIGYIGHSVQMRCTYESGYETNGKYLCTGKCSPWQTNNIVVQSGSLAKDPRFSLEDDTAARVFIINISDLRSEDEGQYSCGVQRSYFPDLYTRILLLVKRVPSTISTYLSPSPTTAENTEPSVVQHSTTLFSVSASIHPESSQLPPSPGFIILYVLISLTVSGLSLSIMVLFCKRKTFVNSPVALSSLAPDVISTIENITSDENDPPGNRHSLMISPVYHSVNPNPSQTDAFYKSVKPKTTQIHQVYQSVNSETTQSENQNISQSEPFCKSINPKTSLSDPVYQRVNSSSSQSDPVYQSPNTGRSGSICKNDNYISNQSDSIYQSVNHTSQSDSVYQTLNPSINQSDPVYQSINFKSNQSDSVYQSLNPTTNQSDPVYQSLNPTNNQSDLVYQSLNPTSSQSDSAYQSLNPNTNQSNSVYQSLNPNTNQSNSVYQSLNPNTNQSNSVYQSLNPNTNQSNSVYQSLNPNTNQSNSVYQSLNPNTNQSNSVYQSFNPNRS